MKISVIIASYKRVRNLKKCLESLEKQIRKPDEVVVALQSVDKESIKFIKDKIGKFSNDVKLALTDRKGKIFQENAALKKVSGEIVCFIDDDAQAKSDWLRRIEEWYLEDERIGGVGGRDIVHQSDGSIDQKETKTVGRITFCGRSIGNHHNIVHGHRWVHYLKGCNMSYKRNLLGFIDTNLQGTDVIFEEQWIGLHIMSQGYRIIYDPEVLVDHYPSKFKGSAKRAYDEQRAILRAHNQIYVLLIHFAFPRKIVFLLYCLLIGDSQNPAIGRILMGPFKGDFFRIKKFMTPSYRGKIRGLIRYHERLFGRFGNLFDL